MIEQVEKGGNSVAQSEIKQIIMQLKKKEIRVFDVPVEYENDIQIVTFERKAGLRVPGTLFPYTTLFRYRKSVV